MVGVVVGVGSGCSWWVFMVGVVVGVGSGCSWWVLVVGGVGRVVQVLAWVLWCLRGLCEDWYTIYNNRVKMPKLCVRSTRIRAHKRTQAHTCTYIQKYSHTCVHTYTRTVCVAHMHTHAHTHTYIHV